MKRRVYGFFALLALSLTLLPFVSAYTSFGDVGSFVQNVIQSIQQIGTPIFSSLFGSYSSDEFLFSKILLFILLFVVIKVGVKATPKLGERNFVVNIIALVVSLFAVRYISENQLTQGILLPYGTLGVALVTLLPFVIYFFFVEKSVTTSTGRKIAWMLFIIIFAVLWFNRATSSEGLPVVSNYLYMSVVLLGVFLFFFDKGVQKYFDRRADYEHTRGVLQDRINKKKWDYQLALNADDKERMGKLLKEIKYLEEEKHKYS